MRAQVQVLMIGAMVLTGLATSCAPSVQPRTPPDVRPPTLLLGQIAFDTKGVDFGPWLHEFNIRIRTEWNRNITSLNANTPGRTDMNFVVTSGGSITDIELIHFSGSVELDQTVIQTLQNVSLLPLPSDFPDEILPIQSGFFFNMEPPE